jgi:carbamoyl-phosphate synthase large subunit
MVFGTPAHNSAAPFAVVVEKTELAHGNVGNAVSTRRLETGESVDVGNVAMAAVRALGLTGPVDVDVRRRADGTPVVLEVNARFGANSEAAPELLDAVLASFLLPSFNPASFRSSAGAYANVLV